MDFCWSTLAGGQRGDNTLFWSCPETLADRGFSQSWTWGVDGEWDQKLTKNEEGAQSPTTTATGTSNGQAEQCMQQPSGKQ